MGNPLAARKSGKFKAVSTAPSINKTPMGNSTPPIPYPVTSDLSSSTATAPRVRFNGDPAYLLDQSKQPQCTGDEPGTAKGIKSSTTSGEVKPTSGCTSVRVQGKQVVRERDQCTMNSGNCPGIYVSEPAPAAPGSSPNPEIKAETPEEESYLDKAQKLYDKLNFKPMQQFKAGLQNRIDGMVSSSGYNPAVMVIGAVATALNEVIVPDNVIDFTPGKLFTKGLKGYKAVKGVVKAEKTVAKAEIKTSNGGGMKVAGKGKKGPCDHLKAGNGKGPYRGGAHSKTSKPANDGKDSHHMPAKDVSPLPEDCGPAIQMDPQDHRKTSSNGNQGRKGALYRGAIGEMLAQDKWRDAMATEIRDVRKAGAKNGGYRKYNEAVGEMLAYFKCLQQHGLSEGC